MARLATKDVAPQRLPDGFKFRKRVDGAAALGFFDHEDQVMLIHTRGQAHEEWANPLSVHYTRDPHAVLECTENRAGIPLGSDLPTAELAYHDGLWGPSATGEGPPRWLTGTAHSITVRTGKATYAVRAPRTVAVDDLLAVARSLPIG